MVFKFDLLLFSVVTDVDYLQGENLLDLLDNGVLLCQLAKVIQEKAEAAVSVGLSSLVR